MFSHQVGITPSQQSNDYRQQVLAGLRQVIVVAGRLVAVGALLDEPVSDQDVETIAEDVLGDPEFGAEFVEAV